MQSKEKIINSVNQYRIKYALDGTDENLSVVLHLINSLSLDRDSAIDQSSNRNNDYGIDGWFYNTENNELNIFQSKLSESKALALRGLNDLLNASNWLENIFINGSLEKTPDNPALYNLYMELAKSKQDIKCISFVLLSLFNDNELEDSSDSDNFNNSLLESGLYKYFKNNGGSCYLKFEQYCLTQGPKKPRKKYQITKLQDSTIILRDNAHLDLAYIPLYNLVELYRQRGDVLFDKNVRMSLLHSKDAKDRLVNPMEATFDSILKDEIDPNIFPFYHVGITISALNKHEDSSNTLNLESPSIINGAQTIAISNQYLKRLENQNSNESIEKFKTIKVIAKIVTGTSDDELKEITNSNNRQNPIENWQLFSNDPIHIAIELALKEYGVFYERQKGKFNSIMKIADYAKNYYNTNNSYITVTELGQIIALTTRKLQWAAKPSEIFINKINHDSIFNDTIQNFSRDIVLLQNLYRAIKRALYNYLKKPAHLNDTSQIIFSKPIVKAYVYHVAIIYYYQMPQKESIRHDYSQKLFKIASPTLVSDVESFYLKCIAKIKSWYVEESKGLDNDLSSKKLDKYFTSLLIELGIDANSSLMPFTSNSIQWDN